MWEVKVVMIREVRKGEVNRRASQVGEVELHRRKERVGMSNWEAAIHFGHVESTSKQEQVDLINRMQLFIFNINVGIVKSISATLGFSGWQYPVQDISLVTKACYKHEDC
jgi:hypothetical protein